MHTKQDLVEKFSISIGTVHNWFKRKKAKKSIDYKLGYNNTKIYTPSYITSVLQIVGREDLIKHIKVESDKEKQEYTADVQGIQYKVYMDKLLANLNNQIHDLKEQIKSKDIQIESLHRLISQEQSINKNLQDKVFDQKKLENEEIKKRRGFFGWFA